MKDSAGIVLAGGRSRRMGTDKALLQIDGVTLLERTVRVLAEVVHPVIVVGRTALPSALGSTRAVADAFPHYGPVGGIATGLRTLDGASAIVVSCDLPFLQAGVLRLLHERSDERWDMVVPLWQERPQVTCALYRPTVLSSVEAMLERREHRLSALLDRVRVHIIPFAQFDAAGCHRHAFYNINTPEEWQSISTTGPA